MAHLKIAGVPSPTTQVCDPPSGWQGICAALQAEDELVRTLRCFPNSDAFLQNPKPELQLRR